MRVTIPILILLILSLFAGCFSDDGDDFDWADPQTTNCNLANDLTCTNLFPGTGTPHHSEVNPQTNELWIIYLSGMVKIWQDGELIQAGDLSEIVNRCHTEQGLLGFAFDANYNSTKQLLLSYVEKGSCEGANTADLVLASVVVTDDVINLDTLIVLKTVEQPYRNHNGGHLLGLGNGKYLWGIGDGGGANDPEKNGQNSENLLGTIVYFQYSNGEVNPVINSENENSYILHYGLRNPWKFDVGPNEELWIADVGQNCWEEINLVNLVNKSNLGWSEKEGFSDFSEGGSCEGGVVSENNEYTDPVFVYGHNNGNCSITGGFWIENTIISDQGGYLFGDFCSGSLWILSNGVNHTWKETYLGNVGGLIVGFGEGANGELLVFFWTGEIIQITQSAAADSNIV